MEYNKNVVGAYLLSYYMALTFLLARTVAMFPTLLCLMFLHVSFIEKSKDRERVLCTSIATDTHK